MALPLPVLTRNLMRKTTQCFKVVTPEAITVIVDNELLMYIFNKHIVLRVFTARLK